MVLRAQGNVVLQVKKKYAKYLSTTYSDLPLEGLEVVRRWIRLDSFIYFPVPFRVMGVRLYLFSCEHIFGV